MTPWLAHLAVTPVVLPLAAAALMLLIDERRLTLKGWLSALTALAVVVNAGALAMLVDTQGTIVYRLGDWPAPFGIVFVVDRLAAVMVLTAAVLTLAATVFSLARWDRAGPRFHVLVQCLLMGLDGAFLTGDLFNLFVFFELLLAASYGLVLHGSGPARVQAALHYIVINLTASLFFLVGVALIYSVTGTLNMADLAVRIPLVPSADRALADTGLSILVVAFLVKAGMWPLGFWLPTTYAAASAPAAALLAILSKVGVYAVLRLSLLFGDMGVGNTVFLYGGMATLVYGLVGLVASQDLSRLAGFSLLVSSGTLLAAVGLGAVPATAAAIYYMVASTLGIAALYLLIELIERARTPGANVLAVTADFFGQRSDEEPGEEPGLVIPATMATLGLSFACCAVLIAGLPPLPGFVAKFALLSVALSPDTVPATSWTLLALLLASGLAAVIGLGRAGIRVFWATPDLVVPRVRIVEMAPVAALVLMLFVLTAGAAPVMRYLEASAAELHASRGYVYKVLP